jgi:hypothetical protein
MPGVFRPYTLVDILGTLNDQSSQAQGGIITSQGFFSQTAENFTSHDTMTTTVQANPTWDNGFWGSFTWG